MTEQKAVTDNPVLTHKMGRKFLFAFAFLATISLANFLFIRYQSTFEDGAGAVINISGQQRMLSQRIGLLSVLLLSEQNTEKQNQIQQELRELTQRLETYHKGLLHGDASLKLSAVSSTEIKKLYYDAPFQLDEKLKEFIQYSNNLANTSLHDLSSNDLSYQKVFTASSNKELLAGLNKLVAGYELLVSAQLEQLQIVNNITLVISALAFFLTGWMLIRPLLAKINAQFSDIIQQKNQLKNEIVRGNALLSESKLLRMTVERITESIIVYNKEGIIEYVNKAFEKTTGYAKGEVIGNSPEMLHSGVHDEIFYQEIWDILLTKNVWRGVIINKKKNGEQLVERNTIAPILDDNGEIVNFVAIKYDVSKEMALERQLRQSQKMEAIGTMAGGIAHDFNNILASILGYTQLLQNCISSEDEKAQNYLEVINFSGLRAKDLVKQILLFSRQSTADKKPVQIQQIISESMELIRPSLSPTIKIDLNLIETPTILADSTQIHQVIVNLCINAGHAMADGGTLSITLEDNKTPPPSSKMVDAEKVNNFIKLTISDNGIGMSNETLERIFEPFFSTKDHGKGTGLGLSVVSGIISHHDSYLDVESEIEVGTTFSLYFPQYDNSVSNKAVNMPAPDGRGEHIVVIDDEVLILQFLETLLEDADYKVTQFSDSQKGLDYCKANIETIDLVITDYAMPELSGLTLAKELKALDSNMPIILSTGFEDSPEPVEDLFFEVLSKPFLAENLKKVIQAALHSKLQA